MEREYLYKSTTIVLGKQTHTNKKYIEFLNYFKKADKVPCVATTQWGRVEQTRGGGGGNQHTLQCVFGTARPRKATRNIQRSSDRQPKTFFFSHTWAGRHSCKRQQEAGGLVHITSPQPNTPLIGQRTSNTLRREGDFLLLRLCGLKSDAESSSSRTVTQEFRGMYLYFSMLAFFWNVTFTAASDPIKSNYYKLFVFRLASA